MGLGTGTANARALGEAVAAIEGGHRCMTGFPVKLSDTPCELRLPPPELGEHTQEVLATDGFWTTRDGSSEPR